MGAAGYLYTLIYPMAITLLGPNYGAINFYPNNSILNTGLVFAFSSGLFIAAIALQRSNNQILVARD